MDGEVMRDEYEMEDGRWKMWEVGGVVTTFVEKRSVSPLTHLTGSDNMTTCPAKSGQPTGIFLSHPLTVESLTVPSRQLQMHILLRQAMNNHYNPWNLTESQPRQCRQPRQPTAYGLPPIACGLL
jgi:hypothetical protein